MGLIQKLKAALGLGGTQSPDPRTAPARDVDVTVEREPSSESEDAVKGTETAPPESASDEPDDEVAVSDEPSTEESPIEEAEPEIEETEPEIEEATETMADEASEQVSDETPVAGASDTAAPSEAEADETDSDELAGSTDPVTEINGIGAAYGERLEDAGVATVAELAAADPDELEAETDISASRIEGWIDAAKEY